jgi:hypothetical protein
MTDPTTSKLPLPGRFLRKKEVCEILSLSSTQLNGEIKNKRIESGTRLTANSNILVWLSDYIIDVVTGIVLTAGGFTNMVWSRHRQSSSLVSSMRWVSSKGLSLNSA